MCFSAPEETLKYGYKKGVGTVSLFYPNHGPWRAFPTDKTIAPHRFAIQSANHCGL